MLGGRLGRTVEVDGCMDGVSEIVTAAFSEHAHARRTCEEGGWMDGWMDARAG